MVRFVFWETPDEIVARQARHAAIRRDVAAARMRLSAAKLELLLKQNFNPNQPRIPAGGHHGGRWGGGSGMSAIDPTVSMSPGRRAAARKAAILNGAGANMMVTPNPAANSDAPWYEKPSKSQVGAYDDGIAYVAAKEGVDADLIRAVMYVETTHGYYDEYTAPLGLNDTILPMNVSVHNWGKAFGLARADLEQPLVNIEAGTKILKGIIANLPANPPVSVIATLCNALSATKVSAYGARVEAVYEQRLWQGK